MAHLGLAIRLKGPLIWLGSGWPLSIFRSYYSSVCLSLSLSLPSTGRDGLSYYLIIIFIISIILILIIS